MKIAIQMDPISGVNVNADTTFDLALEAFGRGHEIWVYEPRMLAMRDGRISARAASSSSRLLVSRGSAANFSAAATSWVATFDQRSASLMSPRRVACLACCKAASA